MSSSLDAAPTPRPWGLLQRRWPTLAAILLAAGLAAAGILEEFARGVLAAAVVYLVWGLTRRAGGGRGRVAIQVGGVVIFGAVTIVALLVDAPNAQRLLAAGWLGHAAWDIVHYRRNEVVPRWYSELCLVIDPILAGVLLFTASRA